MKVGNIIEFHVPHTKLVHTGKIIKVNKKSVIVIDDRTGLETKIPISEIGQGYEEKGNKH
jgi:uncharacterized protein YkvS